MTPSPPHQPQLILASTSRYRHELLSRLGLHFTVYPPHVDETPQTEEHPRHLAIRLARAKALAVSAQHPDAVVIGSDQVADLHGQALGKPGRHDRAVKQLQTMSGQTVLFHTAMAVAHASTNSLHEELATVEVQFRTLSTDEIEHYLETEQPYDCAGSAKSEGLGIALLDNIRSDDPTALVGLPLIRTARLLRMLGINPLMPTPR
ncbi:MAG TPA: Maf family nucleotide pyrophosphatase [Burkholderiaceae bacterium]|nr:Maf family nucleotide pyrophosphatase [Burkholderiaceae bacterium]